MRVVLTLGQPLRDLVAEAVRRFPGAKVTVSGREADAIATDDPRAAADAAGRRQNVLLFATNSSAIRDASIACNQAGTTLMPAYPWRFRPSTQAAVQSLRNGELGSPGLVRIHRWSERATEEITADTILPEIDLIHWVFDATHTAVHTVRRRQDYLQVHFGFPNGGMAVADFAFGFPGDYASFSIVGSRGAAYADDHRNMNLLFTSRCAQAIRTGQGNLHFNEVFREFAKAVEGGLEPMITPDGARRSSDAAQLVLDLARKNWGKP